MHEFMQMTFLTFQKPDFKGVQELFQMLLANSRKCHHILHVGRMENENSLEEYLGGEERSQKEARKPW